MSTVTTIVKPTTPLFDEARLAIAGFLARYSGPTRVSNTTDLRQYFAWCTQHDLAVFAARRGVTSSCTPAPWKNGAWPDPPSPSSDSTTRNGTEAAAHL